MALTNPNFVFSTNHTHTYMITDFGFFDFNWLAKNGINGASHGRNDNFLSFINIWCSTYDWQWFIFTYINARDFEFEEVSNVIEKISQESSIDILVNNARSWDYCINRGKSFLFKRCFDIVFCFARKFHFSPTI